MKKLFAILPAMFVLLLTFSCANPEGEDYDPEEAAAVMGSVGMTIRIADIEAEDEKLVYDNSTKDPGAVVTCPPYILGNGRATRSYTKNGEGNRDGEIIFKNAEFRCRDTPYVLDGTLGMFEAITLGELYKIEFRFDGAVKIEGGSLSETVDVDLSFDFSGLRDRPVTVSVRGTINGKTVNTTFK